jgi:hypothetical protein
MNICIEHKLFSKENTLVASLFFFEQNTLLFVVYCVCCHALIDKENNKQHNE